MVESARLEIVLTHMGHEGSNPSPSATIEFELNASPEAQREAEDIVCPVAKRRGTNH